MSVNTHVLYLLMIAPADLLLRIIIGAFGQSTGQGLALQLSSLIMEWEWLKYF